ncbi:MAG: alpha/beta hydrolase [Anaerolineales bacterium]|jgi:pimeloyl-ACP methyl ester carboxylesterase
MKARGVIFRGETRILDGSARASAPGEFVQLTEGRVHYELGGPPSSRTVVLVPGLSVPYAIWDPTFAFLASAGLRVMRYDLYGRGYSDRPDTRYDQDLMDQQLLELLNVLKIDETDLVGLSLGGAISSVFTARHPERVRRLCLIDPAGMPWKLDLQARLAKAPIVGEWIMGYMGDKRLVSNLAGYFYGQVEYEDLKRAFLEQMKFVGYKRAILSTLRSGVRTGALEAYRRVGQLEHPVMLIWGREDHVIPFELGRVIRDLIPRAEFHPIDRAAHIPHYQYPEIVNPILLDFLSKK